MTRATISIKRESGIYDQIWYVNSSGYPEVLGKEIYTHLKTVDDVERAVVIFRKANCQSVLETNYTIGETDYIEDILNQCNDYSYVLDEESGKWGFYVYEKTKLFDLVERLEEEEEEEEE